MLLTSHQEALVRSISDLKVQNREKRAEFARQQLYREQEFNAAVDGPLHDAMYAAFKAGVPKTRIGQAYQSKDAGTINKILKQYTDNTAAEDAFTVTRDAQGVYTVNVARLANWSAPADNGKVLRDVSVQFTLEDGFPTFLEDDPWEDERAPLARQIEMYANSNHKLNVEIAAKKEA